MSPLRGGVDPASPRVAGIAATLSHTAVVAGLVLAQGPPPGVPPTARPAREFALVVGFVAVFSAFLVGVPVAAFLARGYVSPAVVSVVGVSLEVQLFRSTAADGESLVLFGTLVAPVLAGAVLVACAVEWFVRERTGLLGPQA